jgi:hypothetical protein
MKLITRLILSFFIVANLLIIQSCTSENEDNDIRTVNKVQKQESENADKADRIRKILYSVPSHIEMIRLIKGSGIEFDKNIMNSPSNVANYNSVKSQAFNLGVYGTDLAFISVFEQTQEVLNYFSAIKTLADELGVSNVINDENIQRFERNIENQDSLIVFISEIFYSIDETLNEDDRGYVSAEVISGGWIEAIHIMTQSGKKMTGDDKEGIKKMVADQRYSLENIIALIKIYDNDDNLGDILVKFEKLDLLFDKLNIVEESTTVTKDEKTGKVIIGGADEIEFSDELFLEISNEIDSIRNYYVN